MTGPVPPLLPPAPPIIASPPPAAGCRRPRVLTFYRVWCALFVVLYGAMTAERILIARGTVEPHYTLVEDFISRHDPALRSEWAAEKRAEAPGVAGFMAGIALLYLAAALIPRKPWAWTFGVVALATTVFPFIVTVAGMLPLLVYWVHPEMKRYFGRAA